MTCDDYLAMLETLPLDELRYGGAREHAAHCHDCDRVTRVVVERERSMMLAMGDARSSMASAELAHHAVAIARRRRVAAYYKIGLAIATVATLMVMAMSRVVSRVPASLVHETFLLQCLSPDQASALLRTHLRDANRLAIRIRPPLGVLDVAAPSEDAMQQVRGLIDRYDDPSRTKCAVQVVVPK